ncbi:MAG: hypothetical protein WC503_02715 [Candidatus Shapirobacteria bacterium]
MIYKKRKAQGVVESVFAIGLLGLLMGGAVILVVMSIGNRQVGFDRRKASELMDTLTEELIAKSQNDPQLFWMYENNGIGGSRVEYPGYVYTIGYTNILEGNLTYPNCGVGGKINCAEVTIRVDWPGKDPQTMTISRFFSKK